MELSTELRVVPLLQLCLQVDGTLPSVPPCRQPLPLPPPLALLCGRDAAERQLVQGGPCHVIWTDIFRETYSLRLPLSDG